MIIKCSQCNIISEFNTSKRAGRGFDVNKRLVYTMRVLGHDHSGLEKFAHLMNMPKPMNQNNYDKCIKSTLCAVKEVAEDTMADAAAEIRGSSDGVVDKDVSGDGTWHRRGYFSLNGVFAALSTTNGKVLDVEPMSRSCKSSRLKLKILLT